MLLASSGTQSFVLSKNLFEALKELSAAGERGITLFMILLAAFKTLLYRYTEQEVIMIGSPVADRTQADTEGLPSADLSTLLSYIPLCLTIQVFDNC